MKVRKAENTLSPEPGHQTLPKMWGEVVKALDFLRGSDWATGDQISEKDTLCPCHGVLREWFMAFPWRLQIQPH